MKSIKMVVATMLYGRETGVKRAEFNLQSDISQNSRETFKKHL